MITQNENDLDQMKLKSNPVKMRLEYRILALSQLADSAIARNQNDVAMHFLKQSNSLKEQVEEVDFKFRNYKKDNGK